METPPKAFSGELKGGAHHYPVRVYYEDTDAGGVVYHTAYLRWAERARTEFLRLIAGNQTDIKEKYGLLIVVRRMVTDYLKPASLDDELDVVTEFVDLKKASFQVNQHVYRQVDGSDPELLCHMHVRLAAIDEAGKPKRVPQPLHEALKR